MSDVVYIVGGVHRDSSVVSATPVPAVYVEHIAPVLALFMASVPAACAAPAPVLDALRRYSPSL